jgi:hypothetical protein
LNEEAVTEGLRIPIEARASADDSDAFLYYTEYITISEICVFRANFLIASWSAARPRYAFEILFSATSASSAVKK